MRVWLAMMLCGITTVALADTTTVYETKDESGVPSFSNVPSPQDANAKKIVIDDETPPASSDPTNTTQPAATDKESQAITQQLQQVGQQSQALKDKADTAQASMAQAEANLQEAQKAMNDGTNRVGNDQFIDEDYIRHLQLLRDTAKQRATSASQTYNEYLQKHK